MTLLHQYLEEDALGLYMEMTEVRSKTKRNYIEKGLYRDDIY